jgi:hypothetical protein
LKLLDDDIRDQLLEAIADGATFTTAAIYAGIGERTYYRWARRAQDAEETLEETGELPDTEQPFWQFGQGLQRAHARGQVANVRRIDRAAEGGYVVKTRTRRMRNPGSGDLVEETETDLALPDWRAAAWILERRHPEGFGKEASQVEISGPGGGPVKMAGGPVSSLEALSARLHQSLAADPAEQGALDTDVPESSPHLTRGGELLAAGQADGVRRDRPGRPF